MFSTMLAVVATLLFITHRTAKLKHLLVLPHSTATQTRQAVRTRALAGYCKEALSLDHFLNRKGMLSMWKVCKSLN